MARIRKALPVLLAASFPMMAAHAADPYVAEDSGDPSGWVVQITPYVWAAGIEGDVSPFRRAPTVDIEKSFSDIFEDLNFGGFVQLWVRKERFVFSADVMYIDTTDSKVLDRLPLPPPPELSAEIDTTQFTATAEIGYRVVDEESFTLDLLAGARVWDISDDLTARYAGFSLSFDEDFGWVDPIVAARGFFRLSDDWSILVHGDVGGFDVGSSFTAQALATLNYTINDRFALSGGYKVLTVDYKSDGYVFDTTLHGPVVGLTLRF